MEHGTILMIKWIPVGWNSTIECNIDTTCIAFYCLFFVEQSNNNFIKTIMTQIFVLFLEATRLRVEGGIRTDVMCFVMMKCRPCTKVCVCLYVCVCI